MSDEFFAIVNPSAGGGRCEDRAAAFLERLGTRIDRVALTRKPGDAGRLAHEAVQQGARHLLAVGGDGTAYEVLNGALEARALFPGRLKTEPQSQPQAPSPLDSGTGGDILLSVLPLGTGNSLVQHFAPPGANLLDFAMSGLAEESQTACDLIAVTHEVDGAPQRLHALSSVTFGLPTRVADFVNRHLKWMGPKGYTLSAAYELLRLKQDEYRATTRPALPLRDRTPMLFVQNTTTVGGAMQIAPDAQTDDGELDLIWAEPANRFSMLRAFPRVFKGTHISHPAFRQARFCELTFAAPHRAAVMLDGEVLELAVQQIAVLPQAIRLAFESA